MPYVVILGIILCLEIFVFNFSAWKTMRCNPVILAEHVKTNEKGEFVTEPAEINGVVKNVDVVLTTERFDRAQVVVSLTDSGDY